MCKEALGRRNDEDLGDKRTTALKKNHIHAIGKAVVERSYVHIVHIDGGGKALKVVAHYDKGNMETPVLVTLLHQKKHAAEADYNLLHVTKRAI